MVNIQGLNKNFKVKSKKWCPPCRQDNFTAVTDLSFGLEKGECFALLGVNGAGKSTTFKSLTGMVNPTSGKVQISGFDIKRDFEKARKLIGYCP
jgi:ATP-binding cassette, subfamily A (ABC1), member 3